MSGGYESGLLVDMVHVAAPSSQGGELLTFRREPIWTPQSGQGQVERLITGRIARGAPVVAESLLAANQTANQRIRPDIN